ncbi:hypothetical protein CRYUN_Cryun11dG0004700 [Craigia yunnanensis]
MELQFPLVTLFLSTFLFLFKVIRILTKTKANKSTLKLPSGPWKLPVIGSQINLSEKKFSLAYGITVRAAFGKKSKGEMLKLISGMRIILEKIHHASDRILENIVHEHKERRSTMVVAGNHEQVERNLVDVLLKPQQQDDLEFPLTNDHIKTVIQDMFGAESESSAPTAEWTMSEILKNPKLMKKAQNEEEMLVIGKKLRNFIQIDFWKVQLFSVEQTLSTSFWCWKENLPWYIICITQY